MASIEGEPPNKVKIRSLIDHSGTGVVLPIPTPGARLRSVANATSLPIYPGKVPLCPLYSRVIWPQGWSGRVWRRGSPFSLRQFDP